MVTVPAELNSPPNSTPGYVSLNSKTVLTMGKHESFIQARMALLYKRKVPHFYRGKAERLESGPTAGSAADRPCTLYWGKGNPASNAIEKKHEA